MKPIFIANWKMNLGISESVSLIEKINTSLAKCENIKEIDTIVCPSFTSLWSIKEALSRLKSKIKLGAQNVSWEEKGAFTGEISPKMLEEVGCQYVIIGHSERREKLLESDKAINQKVKAALKGGLTPIICVGETFEERKNGQRDSTLERQVSRAFFDVKKDDFKKMIIAYEPVWVIGRGEAVLPEDAAYSHDLIRKILLKFYTPEIVEKDLRVIYGGSVNPDNIKNFLSQDGIDGVLVGSASLVLDKFIKMVKEYTFLEKRK